MQRVHVKGGSVIAGRSALTLSNSSEKRGIGEIAALSLILMQENDGGDGTPQKHTFESLQRRWSHCILRGGLADVMMTIKGGALDWAKLTEIPKKNDIDTPERSVLGYRRVAFSVLEARVDVVQEVGADHRNFIKYEIYDVFPECGEHL